MVIDRSLRSFFNPSIHETRFLFILTIDPIDRIQNHTRTGSVCGFLLSLEANNLRGRELGLGGAVEVRLIG